MYSWLTLYRSVLNGAFVFSIQHSRLNTSSVGDFNGAHNSVLIAVNAIQTYRTARW